ncbi:MAG: type IV secretory system conjugative DNA transfer family protein [Nitrospiria bacterium]
MSFNLESLPGELEAWAGSYEWINRSAEFMSSHTGIHFSPFHAFEVDAAVFTLVAHLLIYLYLFLTRAGTRNSNIATGRFLTKREFKVNYFIPNRFQFFWPRYFMIFVIFPIVGIIFLPTMIEMLFPKLYSYANILGLFLLAGGSYPSFTYLINRNYLDYKASIEAMKVFPMGKMEGKNVGLVGGQYRDALGISYRKEQRQTHVLIVGPTGSGKTSAFLIPGLIEDAKSGDSCFVIDVKPDEDLVDIVGPFWNKEGKKVILFDVWKREKLLGIFPDKSFNDPIQYDLEVKKEWFFRKWFLKKAKEKSEIKPPLSEVVPEKIVNDPIQAAPKVIKVWFFKRWLSKKTKDDSAIKPPQAEIVPDRHISPPVQPDSEVKKEWSFKKLFSKKPKDDSAYKPTKTNILPDRRKGILVANVKEDSTATISGIRPGDILISINNIEMEDYKTLYEICDSLNPGNPLKIILLRNNEEIEIDSKVREGIHFNPLANLKSDMDNMRTFSTIKTIVDTIYRVNEEETGKVSADASYHKKLEKRLVEDLMFAALFQPPKKKNLYSIAEVLGGTAEDVTNFLLSAVRLDNSAIEKESKKFFKEVAWFLDESDSDMKRRKPSMIAGAQEKLALFRAPNVRSRLEHPELDMDLMFNEPCLFIVKAPIDKETEQGYLLASMFARLVIVKIAATSEERKKKNHNVWLYLDEFPNLKIPNITSTIATIRSSSAGVIAAVQDREDMYTSTKLTNFTNSVQSLLTNFGITVLFPGCSTETCEKVAKSFGDKIVMEKSKIQDVFAIIDFRSMKRWSKAPLVTHDALRCMDKNMAMIAPNQYRPFKITTEPYYKNKEYLKIIKGTKAVVLWKPDRSGIMDLYIPGETFNADTIQKVRSLVPTEEETSQANIRNTPVNSPDSSGYDKAQRDHEEFGRRMDDDNFLQSDDGHHGPGTGGI